MADITDPVILDFVGNQVRPRAENLRAMKYLIDDMLVTWFSVITTDADWTAAAGTDLVLTTGTGVQLSKDDITNFVTELQTIQTQLDGVGVMEVVTKPTVRPLDATIST